MEKDDEVNGVSGANYTAEFWEYDARIGRRWNTDPISYAWQSPYACFDNNPIYYCDPEGLQATNDDPPKGKSFDDPSGSGTKDDPIYPNGNIAEGTYQLPDVDVNGGTGGKSDNGGSGKSEGESKDNEHKGSPNSGSDNTKKIEELSVGTFTITAHSIEEMGGLDNAKKILESGRFQTVYNGENKLWSLKFNGNQYVPAEFTANAKTAFVSKAAKGGMVFKVVKVAGILGSITEMSLALIDMAEEGPNIENRLDLLGGGIAFVPGWGWIASSAYSFGKNIALPMAEGLEGYQKSNPIIRGNNETLLG